MYKFCAVCVVSQDLCILKFGAIIKYLHLMYTVIRHVTHFHYGWTQTFTLSTVHIRLKHTNCFKNHLLSILLPFLKSAQTMVDPREITWNACFLKAPQLPASTGLWATKWFSSPLWLVSGLMLLIRVVTFPEIAVVHSSPPSDYPSYCG